jgi:hypothetical protein
MKSRRMRMGGTYSVDGREKKCIMSFRRRNLMELDRLEDLGIF